MSDEQKKRPWQFSLRDVLLIMLIVGLAVGWFVDHRRLVDELGRQQQQQQQNWVWLGNRYPNTLRGLSSLQLLNAAIGIAPATNPPQPDETITDPPPENPEL
jgi:hypothetical protein